MNNQFNTFYGFQYLIKYRKIPKVSPGAYIFHWPFLRGLYLEGLIFGEAYIRRGLSTEGHLPLQIDQASLIARSKFTVFALFYFVFEGNFPSTSPRGAYIWRDDLTEGFLGHWFGGLIFGGAYTWRGLFSEFYGIQIRSVMTRFDRECQSGRIILLKIFHIRHRRPFV